MVAQFDLGFGGHHRFKVRTQVIWLRCQTGTDSPEHQRVCCVSADYAKVRTVGQVKYRENTRRKIPASPDPVVRRSVAARLADFEFLTDTLAVSRRST